MGREVKKAATGGKGVVYLSFDLGKNERECLRKKPGFRRNQGMSAKRFHEATRL